MKLSNFLWTLPFIFFLLGYGLLSFFVANKEVYVPFLIGKSLQEAVSMLVQQNLNVRIISEKEDADLPHGTVINQTPLNTKIKQQQSVYLTISKQPSKLRAPNLQGKSLEEINKILAQSTYKSKIYYVPSLLPKDVCIAQIPKPATVLEENRIILYVSSGNQKPVVFPDLRKHDLQSVLDFLQLYTIKPVIIYEQELDGMNARIIEQKPLPGSIINLGQNFVVQLKVAM